MQLAVTPVCASSSAIVLVKPSTPCFDALYALLNGDAVFECADAVLMIRPQPRAFMPGTASRVVWNTAFKFRPMIAFHLSCGKSSTGDTCCIPALLIRISMSPASAIIASISPTSSRLAAEWVAPSSSQRLAISPSSPNPLRMTSAPSARKARATARPIPEVEPVTKARFPSRNMQTPINARSSSASFCRDGRACPALKPGNWGTRERFDETTPVRHF